MLAKLSYLQTQPMFGSMLKRVGFFFFSHFLFSIPAWFIFSWLSYELPCGHPETSFPDSLARPHLPKSQVPKPSAPPHNRTRFPSATSLQQLTQSPEFRAPVVCLPHLCGHCTQTSSDVASSYTFKNRAPLNIHLVKTFPVSSKPSWDE